jgi:hypothetical protein
MEDKMIARMKSVWSMAGLLAVLALLLVACGGGAEPTPVPLQAYTDTEFGFALEYPTTWVQGKSEDGMVEFKSAADVELDLEYDGGSLIQVMTIPTFVFENADPAAIMNEFKADMLAGMQEEDDEAKVVEDTTAVTVNNNPAAKLILEAQQGSIQARAEVYIIVQGETAALVMAAYPASEADDYQALVGRVVNTFSFIAAAE